MSRREHDEFAGAVDRGPRTRLHPSSRRIAADPRHRAALPIEEVDIQQQIDVLADLGAASTQQVGRLRLERDESTVRGEDRIATRSVRGRAIDRAATQEF
jgi:hypothetical protein